ncbi:hypothetical protein ACFOLJ_01060 [Rugamonas sp. CCM 8940]|uniref:hypothetical protein n=1 Tax=Rugamonas sp. CCM 8940 TaxID=2765359 RepID=UPI0018F6E827|nr:hypothetical protein [Rugamonas sp. CCM 8940]MBJ7312597.1 hypothetical protein [Rugamonas sp. CCM 8940]
MISLLEEKKEFLVLRYSLVEEPQYAIDVKPIPSPKGAAILVSIEKDREFQLNGVRYSFVGFSEASETAANQFPPKRFYVGKMAKLKQAHMGKKIPGDIIETQEDDWLPILTVFDVEGQYIFVRKDYRFGTPEQTMRAIQGGLREPVMGYFNHRIFVEGRTRKEHFWRIVSDHKKFYKLELRLISPNILDTNMKAREALAALKLLFAQDQINITLNNESGELLVPTEPVTNYLEYIEEGEGSWAITTEGNHGGKKTYSSSDNIDTVEVSMPEEIVSQGRQLELESGELVHGNQNTVAMMVAQLRAEVDKYSER